MLAVANATVNAGLLVELVLRRIYYEPWSSEYIFGHGNKEGHGKTVIPL